MTQIKLCKFGSYVSSGVYYALPERSKTNWVIFPITEVNVDTGEFQYPEYELTHGQMYATVVGYFQDNFGEDISDIGRRCLPRGRVEKVGDVWKIYHGSDSPMAIRHEILTEFGFGGKPNYSFEYSGYQAMEEPEKLRLIERVPFMKELFEQPTII